MSSRLLDHARAEMRRAGLYHGNSDYHGEIATAVEELVRVFARQGHSGGSAQMTLSVFDKVVRFDTLTPITSDASEWMEVADGVWQNRRKRSVFSRDGGETYYDVDDPKRTTRPTNSPQ